MLFSNGYDEENYNNNAYYCDESLRLKDPVRVICLTLNNVLVIHSFQLFGTSNYKNTESWRSI